ncbi:hypothetical protein E4T42_05825 [Aureobasidium subglaciale]|nr:hypothetical protein E4T42_05825 [Aureobasidium subglaciale]
MYRAEDQEEGRSIPRAILHESEDVVTAMVNSDDDDDQDSDNCDDFLADIEEDPTSHVAGYCFTSAQVDHPRKHFRHPGSHALLQPQAFRR